jgi:hypothetical protein
MSIRSFTLRPRVAYVKVWFYDSGGGISSIAEAKSSVMQNRGPEYTTQAHSQQILILQIMLVIAILDRLEPDSVEWLLGEAGASTVPA